MIRVDGKAFQWMGKPGVQNVEQVSADFTSTKTTFVMDVGGKVEMTVTFLSPVTPNDLMRQSLIFSYLKVDVKSKDGAEHDVQIYTDISGGKSGPLPSPSFLAQC